jgi:hypothetical protein
MKPLLVASSSCWYGECRSVRDSAPLAVMELRAAWRLWGMGMWRPVRYGESWEAWRSYEVMVCQKSFKDEVILSHCQPCAREGPQSQGAVLLCHGVGGGSKGERDSKRASGCALRGQRAESMASPASVVLASAPAGRGRLLSVGRSLNWESTKRIQGDVKGCRRQGNARPGSP